MARIPDGWVFIPRINNRKKAELEIQIEKRELVFCEHCIYSRWKSWQDVITPNYYCHRGTEPEEVPADHFCGYGKRGIV